MGPSCRWELAEARQFNGQSPGGFQPSQTDPMYLPVAGGICASVPTFTT
jgi:hypothetical protein